MAKATMEYRWINDSDFAKANPVQARIIGIALTQKDKVLQFELPGQDLAQMSVYSQNWNTLIRLLGDEMDTWAGKTVQIEQYTVLKGDEKKKHKRILA